MQKQIIGTYRELKTEPRNVLPEGPKKPQAQAIGTTMPMQTSPTMAKFGAGVSSGKFQIIGDQIKMSDAPVLGYQSANTPMSERAIASKKNF